MWQDFFYFSKGERRGLILLLCLIMVAVILLILKKNPAEKDVVDKGVAQEVNVGGGASAADTVEADGKTAVGSKSKNVNTETTTRPAVTSQQQQQSQQPSQSPSQQSQQRSSSQQQSQPSPSEEKKETTAERIQRLTSSSSAYPRAEKFSAGTVVELNAADTTTLKKIPGIGSSFAKRIVGYRALLGGYYAVTQLSEVYGIDEEKYNSLAGWFTVDASQIAKLSVNTLSLDSLNRHPYIDYRQAKVIVQLRKQKGKLAGWENFSLLDEFTEIDRLKLQHYLSFD
ncbi:MAG: helix-hairpin-helix domain-containing protein [Tannerella sp.]|jgi:DNA uptake protein ComE-like DNA-binding protein|nr:helix-hairpin-helix domain-containing protein [Tannerella sp.]